MQETTPTPQIIRPEDVGERSIYRSYFDIPWEMRRHLDPECRLNRCTEEVYRMTDFVETLRYCLIGIFLTADDGLQGKDKISYGEWVFPERTIDEIMRTLLALASELNQLESSVGKMSTPVIKEEE